MSAPRHLLQDWFEVWEAEPGIHVIAEPLHVEEVRSYLVVGEDRAVLIDTGMGIGSISEIVQDITDLPVTVINSHAHWDHIGGNSQFEEIWIHEAEAGDLETGKTTGQMARWFAPEHLTGDLPTGYVLGEFDLKASRATTLLRGGESIDLGGRALQIMHAPGHSPGGIVLWDEAAGALFSTDVVYAGDLYAQSAGHADPAVYLDTLIRIEPVAARMKTLYPSHLATPIAPAIVPAMRQAMADVVAGRQPEEQREREDVHRFGGFSILTPRGYPGSGAPS